MPGNDVQNDRVVCRVNVMPVVMPAASFEMHLDCATSQLTVIE